MKQLLSNLLGSTVDTKDGPKGTLRDFYFDDHHWVLRYLVCEFSKKEEHRPVLVPSGHFLPKEWDLPVFPVALSSAELLECPDIDSDMPVSRQKTSGYSQIIPWPEMGAMGSPAFLINTVNPNPVEGDPNLRSFEVIRQYRVESSRGVLGRVRDLVVDDKGWNVYGLIVSLGPWFHHKEVLVSPFWANKIDWAEGAIWTDTHPVDWEAAPKFSVHRRPTLFF